MTLRDALAAALGPAFLDAPEPDTWEDIYPFIAVTNVFTGRVADAILADPAFRAALVEAVAEALGDVMPDQSARVGGPYAGLDSTLVTLTIDRFGYAAAIVARMLAPAPQGPES